MFKKNLKCSSIDESKHYPHKKNIPETNLICDSQILPTHEELYDCIMKRKDELLSINGQNYKQNASKQLIGRHMVHMILRNLNHEFRKVVVIVGTYL